MEPEERQTALSIIYGRIEKMRISEIEKAILKSIAHSQIDETPEYDYTGREFKCNDLSEETCHNWSEHFEIGEIYKEVIDEDPDARKLCLIQSGLRWHVDAECFELV